MDYNTFTWLEKELPIITIDALYTFPDIIERTQEKLYTIGSGYWYFSIDRQDTIAHILEYQSHCYDIHNSSKWVYLPVYTGTADLRNAIENSPKDIIFAATSLHTPDDLLTRDIKHRCIFSWRGQ